jgi:hypothetical protein
MTTAYTPILQLALPVTGELNGSWGDVVNNNITSMVEQAIAGLATINTWTTASHTLTTANGTTSEARCAILECSGAPGAAATVICPTASKIYIIKNSVTGGYAVTLKTSAGTGVSVPNGSTSILYCDGTNVVSAATATTFSAGTTGFTPNTATSGAVTLAGILALANGGTNANLTAVAGAVPYSSASALALTAAGTAGQVLTSNGASAPSWSTPAGGVTLANDTASSSNLYPTFAAATSGSVSTIYTGNAKLLYKPSTGELQSTALVASNGIVVNSSIIAENYTIGTNFNAMSAGPVTINSGIVVTVSSGSVWVVV